MNRLKKTLIFFVLIALLFSVISCSKGDTNTTKEYARGILSPSTFESEYFQIKYEIPKDFIFYSEEELNKLIDMTLDNANVSKKELDYAKANTVYEMAVSTVDGIPIMFAIAEKIPKNTKMDNYIRAFKESAIKAAPQITYDFKEPTTTTLAGHEFTFVESVGISIQNSNIKILQDAYFRIVGDRVFCISITYLEEMKDSADKMMNGFMPF